MTMSDIRERHQPVEWADGSETCQSCGLPFPCDAIQQADRADAAEAASMDDAAAIQELGRDLWAARADADRLAAYGQHGITCDAMRDALVALVAGTVAADVPCTCGWSDALKLHEEASRA